MKWAEVQQFESFTKMIMATTTDPVAIKVGNGARIRISDEWGNYLFIQKYMLLNTDNASIIYFFLNFPLKIPDGSLQNF